MVGPDVIVQFAPLLRWKGALDYRPLVITPSRSAACGFEFAVGEDYLLFCGIQYAGLTRTPLLFTHLCSRTSMLANNPNIAPLQAPLLTTSATRHTRGALKLGYRQSACWA